MNNENANGKEGETTPYPDLNKYLYKGVKRPLTNLQKRRKDEIEMLIRFGSNDAATLESSSADSSKNTNEKTEERFDNIDDAALSPIPMSPVPAPAKLENVELEQELGARAASRAGSFRQFGTLFLISTNVIDVIMFVHEYYKFGGYAYILIFTLSHILLTFPLALMEMSIGQYSSLPAFAIFERIGPAYAGIGYLILVLRLFFTLLGSIESRLMTYFIESLGSMMTGNDDWMRCKHYPAVFCREPLKVCGIHQVFGECDDRQFDTSKVPNMTLLYFHIRSEGANFVGFTPPKIFLRRQQLFGVVESHVLLLLLFFCTGFIAYKGMKFFMKISWLLVTLIIVGYGAIWAYLGSIFSPPEWGSYKNVTNWTMLLTERHVWTDAMYSSLRSVNVGHGTLLTLGSTCEFKNNAIRDSMLLVFFALALRIFAIYALGPFMQMAYLSIKSWNSGAMDPLEFMRRNNFVYDLMFNTAPGIPDGTTTRLHFFVYSLFYLAMIISIFCYHIFTYEIILAAVYRTFPRLLYLSSRIVRFCILLGVASILIIFSGLYLYLNSKDDFRVYVFQLFSRMIVTSVIFQVLVISHSYRSKRLLINMKTMMAHTRFSRWFLFYMRLPLVIVWGFIFPVSYFLFWLVIVIPDNFWGISHYSIIYLCTACLPLYYVLRRTLLYRWSGSGSLYSLFIPHHKWGPVNVNNRKAADHDERAARIVV
ncbi:hypothetical protein WR25_22427 [Diploscapter pachys]|uniref:Amino acid permease/ SLC12A domain-containing protein n=1 Tax=Diploscapter pachys TaxID=2018661 RepID=A0A2A2LUB5_9BILA|nr:hypothetical protein WR25_22427 [Diploscapter pachys]